MTIKILVKGGPGSTKHGPRCNCLVCPHCGATEVDDCAKPIESWKWFIRGYKVTDEHGDWSHCLKCGKWFL